MSACIADGYTYSTVIEEGVKIFPSKPEKTDRQTPADSEADEFLTQRDNGNLQRARYLGRRYARRLLRLWRPWDSSEVAKQKKALFAYVVAKVEQTHSKNSILQQTTLSTFFETVRKISKNDYEIIVDSLAFTQYLLCERGSGCINIGDVFARLCGQGDNPDMTTKGEVYYHRYVSRCTDLHRRTCYK